MAANIGSGSWQEHQKEVADKLQNMNSAGTTFTGDVTGDLTGAVTGTLLTASTGLYSTGYVRGDYFGNNPNTYVEDGTLTNFVSFHRLDASSENVEMSGTGQTSWLGSFVVFTCVDASNTCTVTLTGGATFDGTNNKATFDAASETLVCFGLSASELALVANIGSVTLASV